MIPGFLLYYVMMIHDHMMYFGDKQLVKNISHGWEMVGASSTFRSTRRME
jgi:hypothetical protein